MHIMDLKIEDEAQRSLAAGIVKAITSAIGLPLAAVGIPALLFVILL